MKLSTQKSSSRARWLLYLCLMMAVSFPTLISNPNSSEAILSPSYPLRLNLDLCPEYKLGGVDLAIKFRVDGSESYLSANIISMTIDQEQNSGEFEIRLPAQYGKTPLHVAAFCINSFGQSSPSNEVSTTNCDSLQTIDSDLDGISNADEDLNCDNFYSVGDLSNPDNLDTDGDGIRDIIEILSFTDPNNPGSSGRPKIYSGAPFDPDGDNNSNPLAFRSSSGDWFLRDVNTPGNHLSLNWGKSGDIPLSYDSDISGLSHVAVIRQVGNEYQWLLNGPGLLNSNGISENTFNFGIFGDNIIAGPWEITGITSPAVCRLFNGTWYFYIRLKDGSSRVSIWGGDGDIPAVSDYDGDGLFDIAVYRPSTNEIYSVNSSDGEVKVLNFGTFTAEFSFRGDVTGDGIDDITFWEPINGTFFSLTSDNGFDDQAGLEKEPEHYLEMQLGLYFVHLPLPWNQQNGKILYTVVDHSTGYRFTRADNNPAEAVEAIQWGLPGDSLG